MKKQVKNVVKIKTGVYKKPGLLGEVYYVQARHFDENREFITSVKPDLPYDEKLSKHFLQPGDVLIASKGYDHFAVAYKGIIKPAVASSMFIVLRINNKLILPEFLTWYLNHPTTQNILSGNSKGTALPSITKSDVGNLEISIPSIQKQNAILNLNELLQKEKNLRKQIENLRESEIQQQLLNVLK